jgi:4-hydroxy-tetrahydrodipicolinate reductase
MPTPIVVCGAAGRMGRTLVALVHSTDGATLVGAVEAAGHPALGADAGDVASVGALGVSIVDDLSSVARSDTVVLDFTTAEAALNNLRVVVQKGCPAVIGSTGFNEHQQRP